MGEILSKLKGNLYFHLDFSFKTIIQTNLMEFRMYTRILCLIACGLWVSNNYALAFSESDAENYSNFTCHDLVNISLDSRCQRTIGVVDVLKDTTGCRDAIVRIYDYNGHEIIQPVNESHIGKKLTFRVIDTITLNSCWGKIKIEDKYPPTLDLQNDTINCFQILEELPDGSDNCLYDPRITLLHRKKETFDCGASPYVARVTEVYQAVDLWGSYIIDTQITMIERADLDTLICPGDVELDCCVGTPVPDPNSPINFSFNYYLWDTNYVFIDENGYAHPKPIIDANGNSVGLVDPPSVVIDGDTIWLWPYNTHCNIVVKYKDWVLPACGSTYKIRREWIIKDWCTNQEEICTQWITIKDEDPPVVFYSPEFPPVVHAYTKTHDCKAHVDLKWPTIYNDCLIKSNKSGNPEDALKQFEVKYEFDYPDPSHPGRRIAQTGVIPYGESVTVYFPPSGLIFKDPTIQVRYTVSDACWNSTYICQTMMVFDNDPPTPVCDEITQTTLDPDKCWARLYANDLDDGSHDNCDSVHFAIANMKDIEYWRNKWYTELQACYDPYDFKHYESSILELIDEWIDLYVFDTYLDVTECGVDSVVLRVYEDLKTPPYDPHVFKGSEHQWYNWFRAPILRYGSFRCNYVYYYDSLNAYTKVYPELRCDDIQLAIFIEQIEDVVVDIVRAITSFDFDGLNMTVEDLTGTDLGIDQIDEFLEFLGAQFCETPLDDIFEDGILCFNFDSLLANIPIIDLGLEATITYENGVLTIVPTNPPVNTNPTNALELAVVPTTAGAPIEVTNVLQLINILGYVICFNEDIAKKQVIFDNISKYPELFAHVAHERNLIHYLYSGIARKHILDLPYYNDCMIEVIKDDKTPPVCNAPADVTYYCDGVPFVGSLTLGDEVIKWYGAAYAHDICEGSDDLVTGTCDFDKSGKQRADIVLHQGHGGYPNFCVKTPWDGGEHGYYGGPIVGDYYSPGCNDNLWGVDGWKGMDGMKNDWSPIYCRVWLLLDKYDQPVNKKPDPNDYFGTPEYYDNCWYPTIDSTTEGSLNECGVGVLTRTWTVTDKCENQSVCYQKVVVKPRSDFEVIFPEDILANCDEVDALDPDVVGRPIVSDDDCELIGVNYEDQRFDIVEGACYKILRIWTLIDWCVFDPDQHYRHPDVIVDDRLIASDDRPCVYRNLKDDGDGYIQYLQVIKVVDHTAPELTCEPPQIICNYSPDCTAEIVEVDFGIATDNCTPDEEIRYRYIITPEGETNPANFLYGHDHKYLGELPFGVHDVLLIAEDRCGNADSCETQVAVVDCKPPTPYCYNGIATVVMQTTGSVAVWAKDLDAGSFDNCTLKENLYFSFDSLGLEPSKEFTCEDLPDRKMHQIEVEIWVWDEAGNKDKCDTYLLIQTGSNDVCKDISSPVTELNKEPMAQVNPKVVQRTTAGASGAIENRNTQLSSDKVTLYQNRPNPFRNETYIGFYLPKSQKISMEIFDVTGRQITINEGTFTAGSHAMKFNQDELKQQRGILYYRLRTSDEVLTKKMIMLD